MKNFKRVYEIKLKVKYKIETYEDFLFWKFAKKEEVQEITTYLEDSYLLNEQEKKEKREELKNISSNELYKSSKYFRSEILLENIWKSEKSIQKSFEDCTSFEVLSIEFEEVPLKRLIETMGLGEIIEIYGKEIQEVLKGI